MRASTTILVFALTILGITFFPKESFAETRINPVTNFISRMIYSQLPNSSIVKKAYFANQRQSTVRSKDGITCAEVLELNVGKKPRADIYYGLAPDTYSCQLPMVTMAYAKLTLQGKPAELLRAALRQLIAKDAHTAEIRDPLLGLVTINDEGRWVEAKFMENPSRNSYDVPEVQCDDDAPEFGVGELADLAILGSGPECNVTIGAMRSEDLEARAEKESGQFHQMPLTPK